MPFRQQLTYAQAKLKLKNNEPVYHSNNLSSFSQVSTLKQLEEMPAPQAYYSKETSSDEHARALAQGEKCIEIPNINPLTTELVISKRGIKYPRTRKGSVDNGNPITSLNTRTGAMCPTCNKDKLLETVSALSCTDCNAVFEDYWPDAKSI